MLTHRRLARCLLALDPGQATTVYGVRVKRLNRWAWDVGAGKAGEGHDLSLLPAMDATMRLSGRRAVPGLGEELRPDGSTGLERTGTFRTWGQDPSDNDEED
jgi:hypothetical protein